MSKNKNTNSEERVVELTPEQIRFKRTKLFLVIFACVALVGIVASVLFAVFYNRNKTVDYMKLDLSKYVYVPESYYNGYKVTVDVAHVTDEDVETEILRVLCANKKATSEPVYNKKGVTVSLGDVVNIYYRGYTFEDGAKKYFDGGCNYGDEIYSLEVGSGTFVSGFESGLIDQNQNDYATFSKVVSGVTQPGDVINLTYTVLYADGTSAYNKTAMIDLSDPNLDERWGGGFSEYFNSEEGIVVGKQFLAAKKDALKVSTIKETDDGTGEDLYFDMKISAAYRISTDKGKLVVETQFPEDYSAEELRGKTAYFEIYIMSVQDYTTEELGASFITETLKLTAEELSSFDGDDIVAQYKSYIKDQLNKRRDEKIKELVEDAFWEQVVKGAEIKKLPEADVDAIYESSVYEITTSYQNDYGTTATGSELDAYAREYLGLGSNDDWRAALRLSAETSVRQKLIFFYIVREEGFIPTEEEYNEVYERVFDEHFQEYVEYCVEYYELTEGTEEYESMLENGKDIVLMTYGEDYWEELVQYVYAMEKIVALADVTEK